MVFQARVLDSRVQRRRHSERVQRGGPARRQTQADHRASHRPRVRRGTSRW